MSVHRNIGWGLLIFSLSVYAAAQDNSGQSPAPAPAFGQTAPVLNPDNPPVSGLDEPGLDIKTVSRSFISPAIQVSETADSNENNQLNHSAVTPVEHVLGALDLQKFWPKSDLFLEYVGGGAFETNPEYDVQQLQIVGLEAITRWRTGYLTLRDVFSYLPDGSFGYGTVGGLPGLGIIAGLGTGEAGGGLPGIQRLNYSNEVVEDIPRLSNTAAMDVVQALSPRSAFTVLGAFGNAHFYDNNCQNSTQTQNNPLAACLINSAQWTVEAGYDHMISRHDELAGIYAFQLFQFPYNTGGEIYNDVFNLRWSHTISGRMRLIVGAGPQYSELKFPGGSPQWSLNGSASLRYQFEHASLVASWEKFTSTGSGYFAGANTQVARLSFRRPFGRHYTLVAVAGYSHNERLQPSIAGLSNVNSYNEGTAGAIVRRHFGRTYDLFVAYTFNEVGLDTPFCLNASDCGNLAQRHQGTVGVEWHPKPTRIE